MSETQTLSIDEIREMSAAELKERGIVGEGKEHTTKASLLRALEGDTLDAVDAANPDRTGTATAPHPEQRGVEQMAARQDNRLEVAGSTPAPATGTDANAKKQRPAPPPARLWEGVTVSCTVPKRVMRGVGCVPRIYIDEVLFNNWHFMAGEDLEPAQELRPHPVFPHLLFMVRPKA